MVGDETELAPEGGLPRCGGETISRRWSAGWRICVSGMRGGEDVMRWIEAGVTASRYHWHLNPGHLVADEEWL